MNYIIEAVKAASLVTASTVLIIVLKDKKLTIKVEGGTVVGQRVQNSNCTAGI